MHSGASLKQQHTQNCASPLIVFTQNAIHFPKFCIEGRHHASHNPSTAYYCLPCPHHPSDVSCGVSQIETKGAKAWGAITIAMIAAANVWAVYLLVALVCTQCGQNQSGPLSLTKRQEFMASLLFTYAVSQQCLFVLGSACLPLVVLTC